VSLSASGADVGDVLAIDENENAVRSVHPREEP
jgi:hypothetical protein